VNEITSFKRTVMIYALGFFVSLLLTALAYLLVTSNLFAEASVTAAAVLILASLQLFIQAVCFLHLGADRRPFSRTGIFVFTIGMMLVIVIGSIWIMNNLDYRMHMSPDAMQEYMVEQNKKGF
jgi:cytochrome o ubiquinol oxidase operon protein cyoD